MIEAASGSIQLNRKSGAGSKTGNKAKEGAQTNAVAHAEDDGGSNPAPERGRRTGENEGSPYRAREQAQRTVLAAQKVVGEIEAAQHIETAPGNADGRRCM